MHPFVLREGRARIDIQDGNEDFLNTGHPLQRHAPGLLRSVSHARGHEAWHGQRSTRSAATSIVFGNMQALALARSLRRNYGRGPAIYYDDERPVPGAVARMSYRRRHASAEPAPVSESVELDTVRFDRRSSGARVYDVRHRQLEDHLPVRQALPGAIPGAVRQLGATAS